VEPHVHIEPQRHRRGHQCVSQHRRTPRMLDPRRRIRGQTFQGRLCIHGRIQEDDQRKNRSPPSTEAPTPLPLCPHLCLPRRVKTRLVAALCPRASSSNDHVGAINEFSPPAPPQPPHKPRFGTRPVRSDGTTSSTTTVDAGHVAPGTTRTDAFLSFLEADITKNEARH
jgi:hypothetical protein